ncbi:DUF4410 domain-containing protein [Herbaspirillum hiltneri]|uniref:DUF4410 domain-containing protein n=1 Tax=Herbaspirillum hiltneri TaxID=341045 RepID=UPI000AA0C4F7|nr:DUF4410 domain-containing protein [Herbaspirillum hiltneri]
MLKYGGSVLLAVFILTGCAGTVHRDNNALKSNFAADSVSEVEVQMTDEAQKLQTDNTQFSTNDLLGYIERKLDGQNLLKNNAPYRLQVTVTRFRIRSAFSAVMWGIMAGTDSVEGKVRVLDRDGKQVHSFDVSASYGLGGLAGGQDGMRMNWLYGKFAELTIAELTGKTEFTNVKTDRKDAVKSKSTTEAKSTSKHLFTIPDDSNFAPLENADAIPYVNQHAKDSYALYLTRQKPRAYVIADSGAWAYRVGKDALTNALVACESRTQSTCYPYAIDDHVVWQTDDVARNAIRRKVLAEIAAGQNAGRAVQSTETVVQKAQQTEK